MASQWNRLRTTAEQPAVPAAGRHVLVLPGILQVTAGSDRASLAPQPGRHVVVLPGIPQGATESDGMRV